MFYDKPTINTMMKRAMKRLRAVDVHVPDVIAALNAQGIELTRSRFDDLFLMRPERDITASCDLFLRVLAVIFAHHAQALTTSEFFTLAVAMRLPISYFIECMRYFPADEWRQEMRNYGFDIPVMPSSGALIGREIELSQWHDAAVARHNLVLCGPAGIGKTTVACELLRAYEMAHGKRAYVVHAHQIHTFADFAVRLARVFGVATHLPHVMQLHLAQFVHREQPYLLIMDIDYCVGITPTQLLDAIHTALPSLACIVTARQCHPAGYVVIPLTPFRYTHAQAAACQLYRHQRTMRQQPIPSDQEVMHMCAATDGLPLAILFAADAPMSDTHPFQLAHAIHHRLDTLSPIELRMLCVVHLWPAGVTYRLLQLLLPMFSVEDYIQLQRHVRHLHQHHLLLVRHFNDDETYQLHTLVAQQLLQRMPADVVLVTAYDVIAALLQVDWRWEDTAGDTLRLITPTEVQLVYEFVVGLVAHQHVELASQLLTSWHSVWRRFGMSGDIRPLLERCVQQSTTPATRYVAELHYLMGCVMCDCGDMHQGLQLLEALLAQVTHLPLLYARVRFDMVYAFISHSETMTSAHFATCQANLVAAQQIMADHVLPQWSARFDLLMGVLAWHMGDFRAALEKNDVALRVHQRSGNPIAILDTLLQRGIILTSMGDFRSARTYLIQAQRGYTQHGVTIARAQCVIWLCYVAIFTADGASARTHIGQLLVDGEYATAHASVYAFLDAVAAYMALSARDIPDAQQLYALVNQYRHESGIARASQLATSLHRCIMERPTLATPPRLFKAHMSCVQVVTIIMHHFA